jgi:hypothetical protein
VEKEFARRQRERNRQLDKELHGRALDAELEAVRRGKGTPVPGETQALRGLHRCGTTVAYVVVFRSPRPFNYRVFGLDEKSSVTIGLENPPGK